MKKKLTRLTAILVSIVAVISLLSGCSGSSKKLTIAVPNDTTNEARALLLLQENGIITLDKDAGITATIKDITDNPYNIDFKEVEAAQVPNVLKDVDYAVINSNYALEAGLNPVEDALALEGSSSAYKNVIVVKEGNEETDETKALVAACTSQKVTDFITDNYKGAVVSVIDNPTDGYDSTVDYDKLAGTTISVAASPTPHAEVLAIAKEILAEKNITLDIQEFTDYVQPNNVVESGEVYANLVAVAAVHVEPMGIYGGKQTSLDAVSGK